MLARPEQIIYPPIEVNILSDGLFEKVQPTKAAKYNLQQVTETLFGGTTHTWEHGRDQGYSS